MTECRIGDAARRALRLGDLPAARAALKELLDEASSTPESGTAFEQEVGEAPDPDVLFGLGEVTWLMGEVESALAALAGAYAAYLRAGNTEGAVLASVSLYIAHGISRGEDIIARSWVACARRPTASGAALGWVEFVCAHAEPDPVASEAHAREARRVAIDAADPDLALCAISQVGVAQILQGRRAEGMAMLDEAMAAALAGEGLWPQTPVVTWSNLIAGALVATEFSRVVQWIRASGGFGERFEQPHLYASSRTAIGAILFATGDWTTAELDLVAGVDPQISPGPGAIGIAAARLAELRWAQGQFEAAERILEGLSDHASCAPIAARLVLARGDAAAARRIIGPFTRAGVDGDLAAGPQASGACSPLDEAMLWELLAEIGDDGEAELALAHLRGLAEATGCPHIGSRLRRVLGRRHGDLAELERALGGFLDLDFPYEAARTRLVMSELLEDGEAIAEARAAFLACTRLGASAAADLAAARLRRLGAPPVRPASAGDEVLSPREREVLALLGEGLTNRELCERLFLSRKTIERHVRNVYVKLGLRNRAEAAAYVARHGPSGRPAEARSPAADARPGDGVQG